MPAPTVYLDECVDQDLAASLRARGFGATTTRDEGMSGAGDEQQLQFATQRGWTLISHNKRHFQRWHRVFQQQGRTHSGIILLPKSPLPRLELRAAMTLDWIDQQAHPIGSSLLLWNDVQQWLNQGRMLRGYSRQEIQEATGQAP
jgi:hypothetical protein